jgi:hypothetical protein
MYSSSIHDTDPVAQKHGIDRKIFLNGGKVIGIDEKIRMKWYGDILLEEYSSIEYQTPGWIEKPLWCDYIAYLIVPEGKCFLLPFTLTQNAWLRNKLEWKRIYRRVEARNLRYTTVSYAIPVNVLYLAMFTTLTSNFNTGSY